MFRISNKNKRTIVFITYTKQKEYKIKQKQSLGLYLTADTERNLIGRRTQSDRTPNGIRSGGGRNPIGRRTQNGDKTRDNG